MVRCCCIVWRRKNSWKIVVLFGFEPWNSLGVDDDCWLERLCGNGKMDLGLVLVSFRVECGLTDNDDDSAVDLRIHRLQRKRKWMMLCYSLVDAIILCVVMTR